MKLFDVEVPDVAIGAIAAALIAGIVSLLGLIISKEQKVSEFRQAWIDALREEIAEVIAHSHSIFGGSKINVYDERESWERLEPVFVGFNVTIAKIRLRLNKKESEAEQILKKIDILHELLLHKLDSIDYKILTNAENELVEVAQIFLKKEWVRVRKGEIIYRYTRNLAFGTIIGCLILLFGFAIVQIALLNNS